MTSYMPGRGEGKEAIENWKERWTEVGWDFGWVGRGRAWVPPFVSSFRLAVNPIMPSPRLRRPSPAYLDPIFIPFQIICCLASPLNVLPRIVKVEIEITAVLGSRFSWDKALDIGGGPKAI